MPNRSSENEKVRSGDRKPQAERRGIRERKAAPSASFSSKPKPAPVEATTATSASTTSAAKLPARTPPLCRFFVLNGACRYGDNCHFSHELPPGGANEAKKQTPCRFYLQGHCRYGDYCQLLHEDPNLKNGQDAQHTCGICLEPIGPEYNKRFGLLEGCDHVYCMDCVMTWRADGSSEAEDRRVCPTCRTKSSYVIPSWEYCVGEDKKQVDNMYKARLASLPCKRFNGRFGSCPFGRDCFYAHIIDDEDVKAQDKTREEIERKRERERARRQRDFDRDEELELFATFITYLELMHMGILPRDVVE